MTRWLAALAVSSLLAGACSSGDGTTLSAPSTTTAPRPSSSPATGAPSSGSPSITEQSSSTAGSSTTVSPSSTEAGPGSSTPAPQGPLEPDDGVYTIRWGRLVATPGYRFIDDDPGNPLWFIHTDGARDGFAFSLELYTTGYGKQWQGETGTFAISCSESPPGDESTGICPHLDPDGPGPQPDIIGFTATGEMTIDRLDDKGYDITINELTMAFGVSVAPFRLRGTAPR